MKKRESPFLVSSQSGFALGELVVAGALGTLATLLLAQVLVTGQTESVQSVRRGAILGSRLLLGQVVRERELDVCAGLGFSPGAASAPSFQEVQSYLTRLKSTDPTVDKKPPPGFLVQTLTSGGVASGQQGVLASIVNSAPKDTQASLSLDPESYQCLPGSSSSRELCMANLQTTFTHPADRGPASVHQDLYPIFLEVDLSAGRKVVSCSTKNPAKRAPALVAPKTAFRSGIISLGKLGANLGSDCDRLTLLGHWQSNAGDQAPFQGAIIKKNGVYHVTAIGTGSYYGDFDLKTTRQCLTYTGTPDSSTMTIACFSVNSAGEVVLDLGPQTRTAYSGSRCEVGNEIAKACRVKVDVKGVQDSTITLTADAASPASCQVGTYCSQQGCTNGITAKPGVTKSMWVQSSPWPSQMDAMVFCPQGTQLENCRFLSGSGPLGQMECSCTGVVTR